MTPSLSQQIEAIEAECRAVLELADKATVGPWATDEMSTRFVWLPKSEHPDENIIKVYTDHQGDASFIATSRTITPKLARVTLTAIVALQNIMGQDGYWGETAELALQSICDTWLLPPSA